jgi:hypothetical protein
MESVVRKLRAETYREQLALCEEIRETLASNLNSPFLTIAERIAIVKRCDATLTEIYSIQLMLALIDRKDREEEEQGAATS